ncbi:AraC family transcriptional regulator [uncultured Erythrobacter sp.]|uniref:AraC family transcriptional regulator n=1 Tax=uncultured Erythrobacter sp. TaxID=263913 RepID=UPI00263977DD|nr:AraC family transcriptional regulator [uncultured Erythrobacter sp.]
MATQASFADWYKQAYAGFPQEHRAAGASGLELFCVEQDSHESVDEMGDSHCIAMAVRQDSLLLSHWDFGDGKAAVHSAPGHFVFQPADSAPRISVEGRHDLLVLSFPDSAITATLGEAAPTRRAFDPLTREILIRDREIRQLILSLWDTAAKEGLMAGVKMDSLFQLMIVRLAELSGQAVNESNAGLSQEQIAKACALIEDRLGEGLSLPEIAGEVGVSPFHFARRFKAQTGDTPHGYIMERRLARAKEALHHSRDPIADIAYACGFSSQQHMTTAFSKNLGVTPARYRKTLAA